MYIRVLVHVDMCGLAEAVGCELWAVACGFWAVGCGELQGQRPEFT